MKAWVRHAYGTPDVLELAEVDVPTLNDDRVLIRVHASCVNPYDWHEITGEPYLVRLMSGLRQPKVLITPRSPLSAAPAM